MKPRTAPDLERVHQTWRVTHFVRMVWWVQWVALGWGIGLISHAVAAFQFLPFFGAEWEKGQVEKRLGRPL